MHFNTRRSPRPLTLGRDRLLQVEVFNILFVKEIDKKHMVHCIECALKLSKTLKNIVVLEEYTKEELHRIYDNFVLKTVGLHSQSRRRLPDSVLS